MLEKIYGQVVSWRNFLFDGDILDAVKLETPVLSVGNLTAGGSGKTPMVEWILEAAKSRSLQTCVVSRNYRAQSNEALEVDLKHPQAAIFFGDEACQIKSHFPESAVWTGPQKYVTAQLAVQSSRERNRSFDLMVVDDGFQHRSLNRDFDLVLIDASAPTEHWSLLPKGRMREPFSELRRADAVVLTKINYSDTERLEFLRAQILKFAAHLNPSSVGEVAFRPKLQEPLLIHERVLLVSGIAQPNSFLASVKALDTSAEVEIIDHLVYPDHHQYSVSDMDRILKARRDYGGQRILTTAKDAIKFRQLGLAENEFQVVGIQLEWEKECEELNGFLSQIRRS